MQHLLEKLGYHYCGKVPIDGVRLAYQKIKRKAETSLFQVVSEEDPLGPKSRKQPTMTLYLKQFYRKPYGASFDHCQWRRPCRAWFFAIRKRRRLIPMGRWSRSIPSWEGEGRWLDHYFCRDPIAISFPLAPQGTAFQERVWQLLREIPYGETRPMAQLAQDLSCGSAQAVGQAVGRNPLTILVPCHRVMGKRWTTDGLCVWTRSPNAGSYTMKELPGREK